MWSPEQPHFWPQGHNFNKVVVDFLFIVTPIVEFCSCSMFCYTLLYVHSSIAIILMGKRELVALLNASSWCLVIVEWLFLAVPWVVLGLWLWYFLIILTYYFCKGWLFFATHQKSRLYALWFQTRRFESFYLENLVLACVTYIVWRMTDINRSQ